MEWNFKIMNLIINICTKGSQRLIFYWHQHVLAPEQSSLPLFSTKTINLDPVTGPQRADNTFHRWLTCHGLAAGPIRATATNMVVPGCPSWTMWLQYVDVSRSAGMCAYQVNPDFEKEGLFFGLMKHAHIVFTLNNFTSNRKMFRTEHN